jgi:hypothetical protein
MRGRPVLNGPTEIRGPLGNISATHGVMLALLADTNWNIS